MTAMELLVDTVRSMLTRYCPHSTVRAAEKGQFPHELWDQLRAADLLGIDTDPTFDGEETGILSSYLIQRALGEFAAPGPYTEHVLSVWLMRHTGSHYPKDALLTLADARQSVRVERSAGRVGLHGRVSSVPWARTCDALLLLVSDDHGLFLAVLDPAEYAITEGANLAGEPRDTVQFADASVSQALRPVPPNVGEQIQMRAALARTAAIAGAADRVLALTNGYATTRQQFGRPIVRFGAVRDHLVNIVESTAALQASLDAALGVIKAGRFDPLSIAVAKSEAARLSVLIARAAHQVHGAIGMTAEYELGLYTRRLWSWPDEYGSESYWSRFIGSVAIEQSEIDFRDLLTSNGIRCSDGEPVDDL